MQEKLTSSDADSRDIEDRHLQLAVWPRLLSEAAEQESSSESRDRKTNDFLPEEDLTTNDSISERRDIQDEGVYLWNRLSRPSKLTDAETQENKYDDILKPDDFPPRRTSSPFDFAAAARGKDSDTGKSEFYLPSKEANDEESGHEETDRLETLTPAQRRAAERADRRRRAKALYSKDERQNFQ